MDLVELDARGVPENVNAVAQLYRGELKWSFANFRKKIDSLFQPSTPPAVAEDWRGMRVFEVRHENSAGPTRQLDYQNSEPGAPPSSKAALKEFLAWGMKHYPAENYAVILSGHGSQEGLLSDSRGTKMPFREVSEAIREASLEAGARVGVVLFDSCSTAGTKAAEEMKGAAQFLVASPGRIRAGGWSERTTLDFLGENPKATPGQLAESFLSAEHGSVTRAELSDLSLDGGP